MDYDDTALEAILTPLEAGEVQLVKRALKSLTEPTERVSAVSKLVGRDISPYKADGDYIGGIDPDTFDLDEYLADRLVRWNRRQS